MTIVLLPASFELEFTAFLADDDDDDVGIDLEIAILDSSLLLIDLQIDHCTWTDQSQYIDVDATDDVDVHLDRVLVVLTARIEWNGIEERTEHAILFYH